MFAEGDDGRYDCFCIFVEIVYGFDRTRLYFVILDGLCELVFVILWAVWQLGVEFVGIDGLKMLHELEFGVIDPRIGGVGAKGFL